ncbi:RHS repeat domain-containing protein [Flavobacterium branchiicola]|uniref:RHS repeat domain-containing protein n=1 Tax=Flavobacterium branchiicola TaxID=1114875 RepID=A0ABV9PJN8_9FLAO|nr:RHS repeat domain-containing protein [Flavobacterium branchiicola]MBS7256761.1 sugar-binding protein [Flavobacterium branchiicola]
MKKQYFSKLIIYTTILFFIQSLSAQVTNNPQKLLPQIIPPSPIAYNLGNYGNVPIGMFTGAPNLNIPLYTYKTTNLEVPISMFYGNNGIKVDEISSNIGQGWNLNVGGVISRIIRDEPDEKRQTDFILPDDNFTQAQKESYFRFITEQAIIDSESDLYSYNFGNYSGKFIYDHNNSIVMMPAQNIKIEKLTDTESYSFIATTPDGVKYFFNNKETTYMPKESGGRAFPIIATSAWYITKIVHPKGDEIYFNYSSKRDSYITSKSQTLTMQSPLVQYDCNGVLLTYPPQFSSIFEHRIDISGQSLVSITSNNSNGEVKFNYLANNSADVTSGNKKINEIVILKNTTDTIEKISFTYSTTPKNRVFLDKIQYNDPNKNYQFEYIDKNSFPERLSFSQDHWGYYNGKNNYNIVPNKTGLDLDNIDYGGADKNPDPNFARIGMLSKIIYPTKGNTVFEYEPNDYYGTKTSTPQRVTKSAAISNSGPSTKEITVTSLSKQEFSISGAVQFNAYECPNGDAGKTRANIRVKNVTTGNYEDFYDRLYNGSLFNLGNSIQCSPGQAQELIVLAEPNQTYIISITLGNFSLLMPQRSCTTASLNVRYQEAAPITTQTNLITGGMRVKSTKDYTSNNSAAIYKRYFYAAKDELSKSSGNIGKMPFYVDQTLDNTLCMITTSTFPKESYFLKKLVNITSSSITSLFDNGSSNIVYQYVTISNGNDTFINGGEEHKFKIYQNNFNQIWGALRIEGSPTDYGLLINGLPETIFYYNSNSKTVNKTVNQYNDIFLKESKSYSTRKYYDILGIINETHIPNVSVAEYKNKSYWNYLQTKEETQYDQNGLNPLTITTNYVYNNPNHLQLSIQNSKSSNNELIETKYYYPLDAEISNEPYVSELISKNMINVPLKIETFRNLKKLTEQKTVYIKTSNNLLVPGFVYSGKFPNSNPQSNQLDKKITFNQYDNKGNILQYTPENGASVSIIWGYNKTQPIAKIENATAVQSAAALGVSDISVLNEGNLGVINALRTNGALPNTMITTYTYIPLVGVSTITDPKGDTINYTYDSFGRLEFVKDKDGNILSENQYNYKQ